MNVLLCRSDVKLAGPAKLMLESANVLKQSNNVYVATGGGEFVEQFVSNSIEHNLVNELKIENRSFLNTFKAIYKLYKLLNFYNIEIIHTFNAHAAVIAYLASVFSKHKIKVFNTVLGNGKERFLKFLPVRYIAVSNSVKKKMVLNNVKDEKISVIYNSIIPSDKLIEISNLIEKNNNRNVKKVKFISIAMFTGKKGQERIIEYLGKLKDILDFEMVFVGDGITKDNCIKRVSELGLSGNVKFVGKQVDVFKWIDQSDLFIHLPDMETFGMVLIEAMARGLPVLSINVGGIPEVVSKETGKLIELDSSFDYFNHELSNILSSENYQSFSVNALERVKCLFTKDKLYSDYMTQYKN